MFKKLLLLAVLLLAACVSNRDVIYHPQGIERSAVTNVNPEWWASVMGLQTKRSGINLFCSTVAIGRNKEKNESYFVSAKHCTTSFNNRPINVISDEGTKYAVTHIYNHPSKDIAFMVVQGQVPQIAKVYRGYVKTDKFVVIGYPGGLLNNKLAQNNWADHGQSGGGVFSEGYGLHTIVSTHVDGVNVWQAMKDLKLEWMLLNE